MTKNNIVGILTTKFPNLRLRSGETYYWSPGDKTVFYKSNDISKEGMWALLHESGHAVLEHANYYSDFELIKLEIEAWEKAKEIAKELELEDIDEDHIQDCLDSYRLWLHKRSLCPDCHLSSIQIDAKTYSCIFCDKRWNVTAERFCRPYRKKM